MFCPKCGQKNIEKASFCFSCGQNLTLLGTIIGDEKDPETSFSPDKPEKIEEKPSDAQQVEIKKLLEDRYTIIKELGAGGMGKVYLARDEKMEFDVVVKEMLPVMATPREKEYIQKHFKEEAKMLFRLKHNGLPRVTDYFAKDDGIFIIMEFIDGQDLETILKNKSNKQIGIDEFFLWIGKALDILKYLHNQNPPIIHRDIKPGNIMLTENNEIYLVDFGVAKAIGAKAGTQTSVGTPGFASPENFFGKYLLSSDIYSLGATFHYMLSGDDPRIRNPFDYPALEKYRDDIPKGLQKIMDRILCSDKDKRYGCVSEVEADLNSLTGKTPRVSHALDASGNVIMLDAQSRESSEDATIVQLDAVKWEKKGDLLFESAACSVAYSPDGKLLVCGTGNNDIRKIDPKEREILQTLTGPLDWVRAVTFSPDGRYIISGSDDKIIRVWDTVTGKNLRNLTGHEDWVRSVTYSPCGSYLLSGSYDCRTIVWSARAWNIFIDINILTEPISSVAYSPDGKMIACSCDDKRAYIWNPKTGENIRFLEGHEDYVNAVAFSPDGKLFATASSDKSVKIWDTESWSVKTSLVGHDNSVTALAFSPDGTRIVTGSEDRSVRVWLLKTGLCEDLLLEHSYAVYSIAFSPQGNGFVSASGDKTLIFWGAA